MGKLAIENLTSKIKKTKAWSNAEDDYSFLYADVMMPAQFRMSEPMTKQQFNDALLQITDHCPSFYPAYFDLGTRLLSVDIGLALENLDFGFDICIKINDWDIIQKDYEIVFSNLEKFFHEEIIIRYALKLIEKFPDKGWIYDYMANCFDVLNDHAKAIEYGRKAVEMEPSNMYYLNNLGIFYLSDKQYNEAEKYFKLSIKADPTYEYPSNNLIDCKIMKKMKLSPKEYNMLPIDYGKLLDLEKKEDYTELDIYVNSMNAAKLQVLKQTISIQNQFKVHNYHSLIGTLRVFFNFVKSISNDTFIWEDIDYFDDYFKPIMHKFIFKHGDADDEILNEIYDSTFLFYEFLSINHVIDETQFLEFKNNANSMKEELFDKMHQYNKIRHDSNLSDTKKEKIRQKLFEGDHEWMFLN